LGKIKIGFLEVPKKTSYPTVGIIGGSGLDEIDGLRKIHWRKINSPFGKPSDHLCFGELEGIQFVFLPRHGRGHYIPPTEINFLANIDALKRAGVTDIISLSAVGSFKKDLPPGKFVLVDQFIDRTFSRVKSFFGKGCVAHVSMAEPVSKQLGKIILSACKDSKISIRSGGTYLAIEGPQFSTIAESLLYKNWGCSVIGMTNMPEAKLVREAEMGYATVAMVTDFDCWHHDHENVSVAQIMKIFSKNVDKAKKLIRSLPGKIKKYPWDWNDPIYFSLDNAIITSPKKINGKLAKKLDAVAGRVLKKSNK
jgi:5'-methylthioadenosine phosphorylase